MQYLGIEMGHPPRGLGPRQQRTHRGNDISRRGRPRSGWSRARSRRAGLPEDVGGA